MHSTKSPSKARLEKILWLSDIHLDHATDDQLTLLADNLAGIAYDAILITGDISSAPHLERHLRLIAAASDRRPVFVVLGNHDFHNGSIVEVRNMVAGICRTTPNLRHLGHGDVITLNPDTALIGHDGWADARAGWGPHTYLPSRDHHSIRELQTLTKKELFGRMASLGRESAAAFRSTLPRALKRHRHVLVATHVPPFPTAACYDDKPCDPSHLPHFANLSAGLALIGITKRFPDRRVTVLAGHTHCPTRQKILPNLEIRVAGSRTGFPAIQDVIDFGDGA